VLHFAGQQTSQLPVAAAAQHPPLLLRLMAPVEPNSAGPNSERRSSALATVLALLVLLIPGFIHGCFLEDGRLKRARVRV
jgi:hypothetical protein